MVDAGWQKNRRILIIDDNQEIHNDFRRILGPSAGPSELDAIEAELFQARGPRPLAAFELASAMQGAEGLAMVRAARASGAPFSLVFTDMHMPPGWDGLETLSRLWQEDPDLQAVLCSAYSDYSWDDLAARFGQTDSLLILAKPFDPIEVRQMAIALTEKWHQRRALKESSRRMAAQYAATRILVEAATVAEAAPSLLGSIGRAFGFTFGALWLATEPGGALRCAHTWSEPGGLEALRAATLGASCAPGEGWPGLAFARRAPSFIANIGAAEYDARAALCASAGLCASLELPITLRGSGRTAGVLEFLGERPHAPDPGFFELMSELGAKLGIFLERRRVEAALRESEAKNRALLYAIPDTILRVDERGTCLDFKASKDCAPRFRPEDVIGKPVAEALPEGVAAQIARGVAQAIRERTTIVFEYQEEARTCEARVVGGEHGEAIVLVRDVTEQRRAQVDAEARRAREETIRAQNEALSALATPLIPISDAIVVVPLVGALDAARVAQVCARLVDGIAARRARIAILDTTGVPSLNAEAADGLVRSAQAARLLGAEVVLTGLQPDVAQTLVALGVDLRGIATHQTLQSGIAFAMSRS